MSPRSIIVAILFAAAPCYAETTFHVIMVADTEDERIGPSVKSDVLLLSTRFDENVPHRQLVFRTLSKKDFNPSTVMNHIAQRNVDSDDVLIFYYSGHGGYDPTSKEHFFAFGQTGLSRTVVRKALQQKRPRLVVLISDSCSNPVTPEYYNSPDGAGPRRVSPLFDSLFVQSRGLVDISSSSPGEFASGTGSGGFFTVAFTDSLSNSNRRASWSQFLPEVRNAALAARRESSGESQIAYALTPLPSLNGNQPPVIQTPPAGPTYYLGVTTTLTQRAARINGVEVTQVSSNSPATRIIGSDRRSYKLVPYRDIITHVNNRPTTTPQDLARAIRSSGPTVVLRVYDRQTASSGNYSVQLGRR